MIMDFIFTKRTISTFSIIILFVLTSWIGIAQAGPDVSTLLNILDYMMADYSRAVQDGKVINEFEYKEQKEFARTLLKGVEDLSSRRNGVNLREESQYLVDLIDRKAQEREVTTVVKRLKENLLKIYPGSLVPVKIPDLKRGKVLYRDLCSSCHGVEGRGDGPLAGGLDPPPINFRDRDRLFKRSVFSLFNTINTGVSGTAMKSFTELSEEDRWSLAFYVSNFVFDPGEREKGKLLWEGEAGKRTIKDLKDLVISTPEDISKKYGEHAVSVLAYLRSTPQVFMKEVEDPLTVTENLLRDSVALYREGRQTEAYGKALDSYLEGFELIEMGLRRQNPDLVEDIERKMMNFRQDIKKGAPLEVIEKEARGIIDLISDARTEHGKPLTAVMSFVSALIIILREGLEAILVVAAVFAILIRSGRKDALTYVHSGWMGALILGLMTWWIASYVVRVSGASRETTEGLTSLLAATVLIYVGFWLHDKSHAERWQKFVKEKIHKALAGRTLWVLSGVIFLAVYREIFEIVLFYQALWMQTDPGARIYMAGGMLSGFLGLVVITWIILRFSVRLPLKTFFTANAIFLFLLAVIFAGHGVAALQEAGKIPADPLPLPRFGFIGLYPTIQTLSIQILLLMLGMGIFLYGRKKRYKG